MTHPVVPVQCSGSRAASFSAKSGLSPFPKMDSTKSRLATMDPGTMKRTCLGFGVEHSIKSTGQGHVGTAPREWFSVCG